MIVPYYYQADAVAALFAYFAANSGNPLVAMPTGTGKSVVIGVFLRAVFEYYPNQRVMMLTHVKELIEQNFKKLLEIWPTAPAGIYSAGLYRREVAPIVFGGIASLHDKASLFGHIDLLLIDEAHLVSPNAQSMYMAFINAAKLINPKLKVIGLSATCFRTGMGSLTEGGLFTDIAFDNTRREDFNKLIAEGFLSMLVPKRTGTELDVSGVHMIGGEFNQTELQAAVDREVITSYALRELVENGQRENRRSWLIFTTGVQHTEHVADMLVSDFKISARAVHSKIGAIERGMAIEAFKSGHVQCLVNNNILTTGFDHPGIDLIGVLRPTASSILWVQMLGRGTRPVYAPGFDRTTIEGRLAAIAAGPKQNCLVLDFARNTKRLGPINDPVMPRARGKRKGAAGTAPVRECEVCATYNHASARYCIKCGGEFLREVKFEKTADERELIATGEIETHELKVDRVTYTRHKKRDRPDSLKVSYFCGFQMFQEWIHLENHAFALHRAHNWWRRRSPVEPPATVDDALEHVNELLIPSHIRVWISRQHPEIISYAFDGVFDHGNQSKRTAAPISP